jgi:glycosyltransferase involved in cell wall biosynthesis
MKVSVVIITLNEADSVPLLIKEMPMDVIDETVFVDGHSTDGTPDIIRSFGFPVYMQPNRGYGDAFNYGIFKASGDIIILMDSDGSHNPADIPRLLQKIDEGYDFVLGSRYMKGAGSGDDTSIRLFGNKFFTMLTNIIWRMRVSDSLYLFAAVKRHVIEQMEKTRARGFEYCVEFIIKAYKAGFKFAEIPCYERPRFGGKQKTIAPIHGAKILWAILRG